MCLIDRSLAIYNLFIDSRYRTYSFCRSVFRMYYFIFYIYKPAFFTCTYTINHLAFIILSCNVYTANHIYNLTGGFFDFFQCKITLSAFRWRVKSQIIECCKEPQLTVKYRIRYFMNKIVLLIN